MAAEEKKYRLRVTAGPKYDTETHQTVSVNANETLAIENEHMKVQLCARIQEYNGFPEGSPTTSSYFSHPLHHHDQYSIAISFIPKQPISGDDLVFGNDFDRPIRDRLPPGFNAALRIVKWMIDPGLDGDAYADKPYLYGPALSSWNYFRIGEKEGRNSDRVDNANSTKTSDLHDEVIEEGGEGSGEEIRQDLNIPENADQRKKHFLSDHNRQEFEFEEGRTYKADFGNPYLVFNDFSLRLPGFSLNVIKYVDEKTHELRYVLKNRKTGDVYFVILFTLEHLPSSKTTSLAGSSSSTRNSSMEESRARFEHEKAPCSDNLD
ncbi:hypothetical protein FQN54_003779 [Arachnomyces sp. PD_36]|nr:hypothetical protein FQN54_003779 [Arachnomyces sp. PD_36]